MNLGVGRAKVTSVLRYSAFSYSESKLHAESATEQCRSRAVSPGIPNFDASVPDQTS
jgi:hypothetical protein